MKRIFKERRNRIDVVIHTAAQPSHDFSAKELMLDFDINARGTAQLLYFTHRYSPDAYFVHCSTSKVYGDRPNSLPFVELDTRFDLPTNHKYYNGITEDMSIDQSKHSPFGCSKASADLYVQEFGRYFSLKTALFRPGCLTGPSHKGTQLHGFLAYLTRCAVKDIPYTIIGHVGKQVRDNINMVDFAKALITVAEGPPRFGEVYNFGGGRYSNCSTIEAISILEKFTGKKMDITYEPTPRIGDHIWYIGSTQKFLDHYPKFTYQYTQQGMIEEMVETYDPER
jgi:CDP-paratose 2-epimerase